MTTLLHPYHGLPVPVRSAAATARGLYQRYWRYGPLVRYRIDYVAEVLGGPASAAPAWEPNKR